MSETKLCPFLCAAVYLANLDGPAGTYKACLQEKCAMWRINALERANPETYGYCGLAGDKQ